MANKDTQITKTEALTALMVFASAVTFLVGLIMLNAPVMLTGAVLFIMAILLARHIDLKRKHWTYVRDETEEKIIARVEKFKNIGWVPEGPIEYIEGNILPYRQKLSLTIHK